MSIPPLHSSNQAYWVNTPKSDSATANKAASIESSRSVLNQEEPMKVELSTEEHTETEQSSAKSFAYGFLGFDKPSNIEEAKEVEVEKEKTEADDAYFAGRVTKGLGTLGTIIAILI